MISRASNLGIDLSGAGGILSISRFAARRSTPWQFWLFPRRSPVPKLSRKEFHAEDAVVAEESLIHVNRISGAVIDAAMRIHTKLGPGLLESAYEMILTRDLRARGFLVERQKPVSFSFEELWFEDAFRVDLVVDHLVVVELKCAADLSPVHFRQLLTYVRLMGLPLGLLLNFGKDHLKDGIKRIVNTR